MNIDDFKIKIIDNNGSFTAFIGNEKLTGLVVQTKEFDDIPKEIAKAFELIINYQFKQKEYTIVSL